MICGIDLDDEIKVAYIQRRTKRITIICKNFSKADSSVKQLYKKTTCTGLTPDEFLINEVEIQAKNLSNIDKALFYQIKPLCYLPNRIDFPYLYKHENEKASFSVFTTTEDSLKSHLLSLRSSSIDPDIVSTTPSALTSFAKHETGIETAYLLHVSSSATTLVWIEENRIKKAFTFDLGEKFLSNKKNIDLFIQKLKTYFLSFQKEKLPLIITGSLDEQVIPLIEKTFSEWIMGALRPNNSSHAIAIGLGLQALEKNGVQFRQNKWIANKFVKRFILRYSFLFIFSLIGSFFVYREKSDLLAKEAKRIEDLFDAAYLIDQNQFLTTPDLSLPFTQKITNWTNELNKVSFPYINTAPSVKQVLAFIENQPLISKIKIEKMDYRLESFSKIGSVGVTPKLFVEIVYSADKTDARKFYEKIAEDRSLILSSEKITWTPLQDTFSLTFYCKPNP